MNGSSEWILVLALFAPGAILSLTAGAAGEDQPKPEMVEFPLTVVDLDHWSLRPVTRPSLPGVADLAWCRGPIDVFIRAAQERRGLQPAPEADPATLVRRLSQQLRGLPAEQDEAMGLAQDTDPAAFELLVERWLATPDHGERWAQHWLDLARFAETDGFEHDLERPNAWRYRDWVIEALNRDLPYDEFVRLQLAGDQLEPGEAGASVATGFLLCGPDMPDTNLQEERRHQFLNDLTGTVGSVLLGLQVGCAACHDHKFDPISQLDFYRLRACFEPLDFFRDHPLPPLAGRPAEPAVFGRVAREIESGVTARAFLRGDFRRPAQAVAAGWPRALAGGHPEGVPVDPEASLGPRSQLGKWVTHRQNPLTARVIVNRVWQQHFGEGLVATPSDFGRFGSDPTHPELLDWLADEFMQGGWSLKRLHRLIVTSATWRQASRLPSPADLPARDRWTEALRLDPTNELHTRFRRRRLDGEEIRDLLLSRSGELSRRRGGPGIRPPLPPEVVQTLLVNQWKVSPHPEEHRRRSVYLFVRRNLRYPLFEAFDRPDTNFSCARRGRSTTAPQSLVILNSELSWKTAQRIAERIGADPASSVEHRSAAAFEAVLGRPPVVDEQRSAEAFLNTEIDRLLGEPGVPELRALAELCLGLINTSELQYVD